MQQKVNERRDPVTGDKLSRGEYISWLIQGVIRRWWFLIAITIITAVVWATNNGTLLLWWNLCASYLALFIESVVGLAMFGQTRRDAVVLREVRTMSQHLETIGQQQLHIIQHLEQQVGRITDLEEITGKLVSAEHVDEE